MHPENHHEKSNELRFSLFVRLNEEISKELDCHVLCHICVLPKFFAFKCLKFEPKLFRSNL